MNTTVVRLALLRAAESVGNGHPDKVCDYISDLCLMYFLRLDRNTRAGIETTITADEEGGLVLVTGEVTCNTDRTKERVKADITAIVRRALQEVGYRSDDTDISPTECVVLVRLKQQSPDISQGVTEGQGLFTEQGAGDQGIMVGYACDEGDLDDQGVPTYMPLSLMLAHRLVQKLGSLTRRTPFWLGGDTKSLVNIEFSSDGKPLRVDSVVIAAQHDEGVPDALLRDELMTRVVKAVIPPELCDDETTYFINATGRFVIGGPRGDAGLTGRKIIVDTYGARGAHGGGAFSGKDPSKVDRSAAYFCRYIAKNLVAAGLAQRLQINVSYAIGVAKPLSVEVETWGSHTVPVSAIQQIILDLFDFRPKQVIERLGLLDIEVLDYAQTAAYGHFGRNHFPWERTDAVEAIRDLASRLTSTDAAAHPTRLGSPHEAT